MGDVDINVNKRETENNFLGPKVKIHRLIFDQDSGERWITEEVEGMIACSYAIWGNDNGKRENCGSYVKRMWIEFGEVVDMWGSSM